MNTSCHTLIFSLVFGVILLTELVQTPFVAICAVSRAAEEGALVSVLDSLDVEVVGAMLKKLWNPLVIASKKPVEVGEGIVLSEMVED